jgi:tetratricopeptide (TPR) repeat protein
LLRDPWFPTKLKFGNEIIVTNIKQLFNMDMDIDMEEYSDTEEDMEEDSVYYIGLMQLGEMWIKRAEIMEKEDDIIQQYEEAIHIHSSFAQELAIYYEANFYPPEIIVENYRIALLGQDSHSRAIINLADFYKKQQDKPSMIQCCHQAIREYSCVYSMILLALHYAGEQNAENVGTCRLFYDMAIIQNQDAPFILDTFVETAELVHIVDFIQEGGWNQCNTIAQEIMRCYSQRDSITIYNNKVRLFASLNHVVECGICFNTILNLCLDCGHCVCKSCYLKLHRKPCPFCRILL